MSFSSPSTVRNLRILLALIVAATACACGGGTDADDSKKEAHLRQGYGGQVASAPAAPATSAVSAEGEWFVQTGCSKCHAVSVYGVKSEAQIGPDLSIAVEDVKTRFGVPIEEFLENPSGTMALVLSSQIQLTPEQKKVAIAKLHAAYAAHQKTNGGVRASD